MKASKYLAYILFLTTLSACTKPDFGEVSSNYLSTGDKFHRSEPRFFVADTTWGLRVTIHGVDTCFVQLLDSTGVVSMTPMYVPGDKYFFEGVTTYVEFLFLPQSVFSYRLFNTKYGYECTVIDDFSPRDTTQTDTIIENGYTILSDDSSFSITQEEATFTVIGPKYVGAISLDKFLMGIKSISRSQQSSSCTTSVSLSLKYVGSANLKFYNEEIDTLIKVEIMPQYTTYEEPSLDFDDNRDSVIVKLGEPYEEDTVQNYLLYHLHGLVYEYTLRVNMSASGWIIDYEITFADEDAKSELRLFIAERYYKTYSTWNGYNVYVRAFDDEYPSIYESTKAVVENFLVGKVIYKNPSNYRYW